MKILTCPECGTIRTFKDDVYDRAEVISCFHCGLYLKHPVHHSVEPKTVKQVEANVQ